MSGSGDSREALEREVASRRVAVFTAVIAALFVILGLRLWQVQIVQGELFLRQSEENRLRVTPVPAPRGLIVDRRGRTIVASRPAFTVAVMPLEARGGRGEVLALARLLGLDPAGVSRRLSAGRARPVEPVVLLRDAPITAVAAVEESRLDLPGVLVLAEPVRSYLYHALAVHLLGYLGEQSEQDLAAGRGAAGESGLLIGKDGVERTYDVYLRGRRGRLQTEVDAQGRVLRSLGTVPAVSGDTVVLGLDLDVQRAAEEALGDRLGVVVALDPRTGAIVALVSHPAFDPNLFSAGITQKAWTGLLRDPQRPLIDRAIQSGYPTGSVYKIITASAALDLGIVQSGSRFYCPGYYNLGGHIFHDHEAHGNLNFLDAIAESCNTVFWTVSRPVGPVHLADYARRYGMGQPTGVDLPHEIAGVSPDPEWKQRVWKEAWYAGDTLNTAVGQGYVLATPMQVARMLAAVATGGTLITPHAVTEIRSPDGRLVAEVAPAPAGRVQLGQAAMEVLRAGLAAVVTRGTAASIQIPGLAVAGKTGTAEDPHGKPHAWFAGYAPADAPQLVVVALVENAGYGAEHAAPIVKRVIEVAFGIEKPPAAPPPASAPAQHPAPGSPAQPPAGQPAPQPPAHPSPQPPAHPSPQPPAQAPSPPPVQPAPGSPAPRPPAQPPQAPERQ